MSSSLKATLAWATSWREGAGRRRASPPLVITPSEGAGRRRCAERNEEGEWGEPGEWGEWGERGAWGEWRAWGESV